MISHGRRLGAFRTFGKAANGRMRFGASDSAAAYSEMLIMDDLKRHIDLMAKGGSIEERLLTFWPVIEPHLAAVVSRLQVLAREMATDAGADQRDFERLKRVQLRHLVRLFSWRIDDDYVDGVLAMHFAFRKAAFDTPAIIAIYNDLARSLTSLLVEAYRSTPGTLASVQKAVTSALLLDLSMLLSAGRSETRITPTS